MKYARLILLCTAALFEVAMLSAQAPNSDLRFEVASIRPVADNHPGVEVATGRAAIGGGAGPYFRHEGKAISFVQRAYGIPYVQLRGGPDWIRQDGNEYRLQAKIPDGVAGTSAEIQTMLRSLLAERFKLVARTETQMVPVYVLTHLRADRTIGPGLKSVAAECPRYSPYTPECLPGQTFGGNVSGRNMAFEDFAPSLERWLGRPVIDRTGITGRHTWDLGQFGPMGSPRSPEEPSFFAAIQVLLGLKLESDRAPKPVLIIERIERPTEN